MPGTRGKNICGDFANRIRAGRLIPDMVEATRQVILKDAPLLTGGFVSNPTITVAEPFETGTEMSFDDLAGTGNDVAWTFVEGGFAGLGGRWTVMTNPRSIWGKERAWFQGTTCHELAHNLGFSHPYGGENVPLPSIIGAKDFGYYIERPTEVDILHGKILYSRPNGTASPDSNPTTAINN